MRAVVQERYGDPHEVLRVTELERPRPGAGEVLLRVRASSVNTPDWLAVLGVPLVVRMVEFGLRRPKTPVRGTDVAGIVEELGPGVDDLAPGDEVFGSCTTDSTMARAGSFAEECVAVASQLVRRPVGLSFEEAAGAPMSGATALIAVRRGELGPGRHLLVNGASGGVGLFAVQIAKALGAEVTGVCSGRNVELVRSYGADHVVDYTREDFTRGERRYDVILDNVLNHPPARVVRALSPGGIFLPNSVGVGGRTLMGLPRMGRTALMRFGRTDVRFVHCDTGRENLRALRELLERGDVRVPVDRVFPLEEAAEAVALMASHRARGKVVISV